MNTAIPGSNGHVREALAENLRHMIDDADKLMKSAVDSGDQKLDEARVRIEHQLKLLRMQLEELEQSSVHRARQAVRRADAAVHTRPYAAIGAAAAVGLLAGLLLSRRH